MKYKDFSAPFFNHFFQPVPPQNPHPNLYVLPRPINMTTMIRQNTKFPPTARSPRQT